MRELALYKGLYFILPELLSETIPISRKLSKNSTKLVYNFTQVGYRITICRKHANLQTCASVLQKHVLQCDGAAKTKI